MEEYKGFRVIRTSGKSRLGHLAHSRDPLLPLCGYELRGRYHWVESAIPVSLGIAGMCPNCQSVADGAGSAQHDG